MYGSMLVEQLSTGEDAMMVHNSEKNMVGCVIFSDMYHFLFGRMYRLQGLFIDFKHRGMLKGVLTQERKEC